MCIRDSLYTTLSKTPCGSYVEGKKQELTEKQKQRFLSGTTIHEVHRLLGTAFQYAVEWGILVKSPVPVDSPKKSTQERIIWTVEEMRTALDSMEYPILHLAVHLTLVGALREGEIVGLTPEDIDFDAADGIGTFRINKSMQRVRKEALKQVDDGCIIKVFPDKLERSTTSLIPVSYTHLDVYKRQSLRYDRESVHYIASEIQYNQLEYVPFLFLSVPISYHWLVDLIERCV